MSRLKSRSLVLRLAIAIGTSSFLLAMGSGWFLYLSIWKTLHTSIDNDLRSAAKQVLHRLVEEGQPLDKEILEVGDHLTLRVVDLRGQVVLESLGMEPLAYVPLAGPEGVIHEVRRKQGPDLKYVVVGYSLGRIQVVRNIATERNLLWRFRMSLYWLLAVVPLLAATLGFLLAKRGLRPVETLARTVGEIRPDTLDLRFDLSSFDRELLPLAQAVNRTLDRLETAFCRLGELNADLAHEMRNPLHLLRLELEELLIHEAFSPAQANGLEGIMETLHYLSTVIEQMLFLARTEDPSNRIQRAPLDTKALLESVARDFAALAEEKDVILAVEVSTPLMLLLGDALLLRRALHNLVANAIRHSASGTSVMLRAHLDGSAALLEVVDHGEGMPLDLLEKIGNRFLRKEQSRQRQLGGAGLGLAIVQGITHLHGGVMEVESQEGVGTLIRLRIPTT